MSETIYMDCPCREFITFEPLVFKCMRREKHDPLVDSGLFPGQAERCKYCDAINKEAEIK